MITKAAEKHILIVGAGPGGLTAAMILAHRGFKVSVFEAADQVGGRNAAIRLGPYSFDVGPTFLMLPGILDEVFHEAGASTSSLLRMKRLEPMYRLQFADKFLEPTTDHAKMKAEIARCFPGREDRYETFFQREKKRFTRLFPCLQKSYHRARTMVSPPLLRAIPQLAPGRSLYDVMIGYFPEPELALSFTFQSKYLGMSPWDCPGLFAIIPYIEHAFGIYHPVGGLHLISSRMAEVAGANGAAIRLSSPVERVLVKNGTAAGLRLRCGEIVTGDAVVINADFGHAVSHLFEPGALRKYTPKKMAAKRYSCSTFMLYLGLDKIYDLPHHTIAFARDYRANLDAIFRGKNLSPDISFYVRNASLSDPTLAPAGHSAVYVLVPAPNLRGETDWLAARDAFREMTLDAMEKRLGMAGIRAHIKAEKSLTPLDWRDEYRIYAGATFNLAHNMGQMIFLRPHNKFEELDRCYLVGGGTHPGSGLPTIYESGRIAANLISRFHGINFVSGNLEV